MPFGLLSVVAESTSTYLPSTINDSGTESPLRLTSPDDIPHLPVLHRAQFAELFQRATEQQLNGRRGILWGRACVELRG